MNRISRPQMFMLIAQAASQRSTCMRRNIGAVITAGNQLISIGYNGPPSGEPHCFGATCVPPGSTGCTRSIHAEANALDRVPQEFASHAKTLYTTESPCIACAARLIHEHVTALFYLNEYRVKAGLEILVSKGLRVFRMTPSGFVIDYRTGELVDV